MSNTAEQLTEHLNALIEQGADMDALLAALEAYPTEAPAADEQAKPPADDMGRPAIDYTEHARGFWNIRDAAGDDPKQARNLAEWACRRHKAALDAIADVQAAADEKVAQIREWQAALTKKHERDVAFFESQLDLYQQDFCADEKTTKLVDGTIERRAMPDIEHKDEEAALAYALAQADVDTLAPRRLSLSALKARLKAQKDGSFIDTETGETVTFISKAPNPLPYRLVVKH